MYKTIMKIDGMMCGMCEAHVNDAVRKALPVRKVTSSHTRGETVILTDEVPEEDAIRRAIDPTGYTVTGITSASYEKKGLRKLFG